MNEPLRAVYGADEELLVQSRMRLVVLLPNTDPIVGARASLARGRRIGYTIAIARSGLSAELWKRLRKPIAFFGGSHLV